MMPKTLFDLAEALNGWEQAMESLMQYRLHGIVPDGFSANDLQEIVRRIGAESYTNYILEKIAIKVGL